MIWLLIGYMFLFIHRPFEIWPSLATVHLERIYVLGICPIWLMLTRKGWMPNRLHYAFFAFVGAMIFCWLLSPWASHCDHTVEDYLKLVVFYVLLVTVVRDEQGLRRIGLAYLVVMSLYMSHSLLEYINGRYVYRMETPRMIGVDTSLGDPNSFGATLVYALPFVLPFWKCYAGSRIRWFLAGYVVLTVGCIALTGSRGSLIGLLVLMLIVVLRSRWRVGLIVLMLLVAPLLWMVLPGSLQNRFETIVNPDIGPANARASGQSRLDGLLIGMRLWEQNPLTGCGPGAWKVASGRKLESHNLYGQLIGEMGTIGALTFGAILLGLWANHRRVKQMYRQHPEWGEDFPLQMVKAVGLSVLLLLFLGNFGHNLYRYSWLWYGGFLIIARHCVEQRLAQRAAVFVPRWVPRMSWGTTAV